MPHNLEARREAAAVPLVLFGAHGRTVEGYRPADEDLRGARPAEARHEWLPVRGPHLRPLHSRDRRSKTGVVGVSPYRHRASGKSYFIVNLGSTNRRFCIDTLGKAEAWRRAVALRREHVRKVLLANAVILQAREEATV